MDATSNCQLACAACPTADGRTTAVLGRGYLSVAEFQRLLEANPELRHVELSNYGEMFLHPQLEELLRLAHERGVTISGSNGVNLNYARGSALEAVVRYRVRALTCSIDGASPDTYQQYRRKGDLERVLRHIDRINELKALAGTPFPLLTWQFVVFGHNEHEIETARAMATARKMSFLPRISWSEDFSTVQNKELVSIQTGLGAATREEFREKNGRDYTRDLCLQLWHAPVANWDGKLLGCCVNFWGDFGANIFQDGFGAAIQSPRMEQGRRMLQGEQGPADGVPCSTCYNYLEMQRTQNWITDAEVAAGQPQRYTVSVSVSAPKEFRFARLRLSKQGEEQPEGRPAAGRMFRFGQDKFVVAWIDEPGSLVLSADLLGPGGWRTVACELPVRERPLCQEVAVDLGELLASAPLTQALGGPELPLLYL